jgi:hypothetical protein
VSDTGLLADRRWEVMESLTIPRQPPSSLRQLGTSAQSSKPLSEDRSKEDRGIQQVPELSFYGQEPTVRDQSEL